MSKNRYAILSSRRRLAVDALDVDATTRVKARRSVERRPPPLCPHRVALHAPAKVLIEGLGSQEHFGQIIDVSNIPSAEILVEGVGVREHTTHIRHFGHVPIVERLVEGACCIKHTMPPRRRRRDLSATSRVQSRVRRQSGSFGTSPLWYQPARVCSRAAVGLSALRYLRRSNATAAPRKSSFAGSKAKLKCVTALRRGDAKSKSRDETRDE